MRTYSFPAHYRRYVEAELAIILARIGRDVNCRADEDVRVRALADVPDELYTAPGAQPAVVTIMLVETQPLVAVLEEEMKANAPAAPQGTTATDTPTARVA